MTLIRVGTRDSALAMAQTEYVTKQLSLMYTDIDFAIVPMKTTGDKFLETSLSKIGDKGLFTKELEIALQQGVIDMAVHSLKDLPTELPPGCELLAITERIDPRDVLVTRSWKTLEELPPGSRLGTSSLRRRAQLLNYRADLTFCDIRGNVPTRLAKMIKEGLDAIVIAAAGLERLGLQQFIVQRLPDSVCLPAVGQGALGIEARAGDETVSGIVLALNHPPSEMATAAERAFLRRLGGGCQIPIAALGTLEDGKLRLQGLVASPDGEKLIRGERAVSGAPLTRNTAEQLGVSLAEELLAQGAGRLLSCF